MSDSLSLYQVRCSFPGLPETYTFHAWGRTSQEAVDSIRGQFPDAFVFRLLREVDDWT